MAGTHRRHRAAASREGAGRSHPRTGDCSPDAASGPPGAARHLSRRHLPPAWGPEQASEERPGAVHPPPPPPQARAARPPSARSLSAGTQQRCRGAAPSSRRVASQSGCLTAGSPSASAPAPAAAPPGPARAGPPPCAPPLWPRCRSARSGKHRPLRAAPGEPAGAHPRRLRGCEGVPASPWPRADAPGAQGPRGPTSDARAALLELQAQVVQLPCGGRAGGDVHICGRLTARPLGSCGERGCESPGGGRG